MQLESLAFKVTFLRPFLRGKSFVGPGGGCEGNYESILENPNQSITRNSSHEFEKHASK